MKKTTKTKKSCECVTSLQERIDSLEQDLLLLAQNVYARIEFIEKEAKRVETGVIKAFFKKIF